MHRDPKKAAFVLKQCGSDKKEKAKSRFDFKVRMGFEFGLQKLCKKFNFRNFSKCHKNIV